MMSCNLKWVLVVTNNLMKLLCYELQGSRDIAQCDHKMRLICISRELVDPREAAVRRIRGA